MLCLNAQKSEAVYLLDYLVPKATSLAAEFNSWKVEQVTGAL